MHNHHSLMSFGLAGPSVPTIYSKRSHPAVKRPGGAPSTAWGSETASSYRSGFSRRGSFGSSHGSSSITPRTHPGGSGGGVPSSSHWEYADEVVSSLKFLRPFVIAAEEDGLAKNASTAVSASSSSSSPAPVVSDRGEKVEQGKMTAMEKEVFTIMKTYVEHKMKKKRGGKGKKEAEVGKKLEIIEDQFLDCPTYVKLFRKIKIQYSLPLPPAPPTLPGSPESALSPPLPAHLSSPTESGFSSDRPLLPPHIKNGSLDSFGSLLNPSFSLGTRRAGGPKHVPASSNGHGNGQGHSAHSSLSSFTPSLALDEIPMPPGMTLNPDRTFGRKPSLGKISSALTFGGNGGEPEITWPLPVDEGRKIVEGKRAEVMKARLIETFLASGVSGSHTMIPTRPQRPGETGVMNSNPHSIPDWSHLPPIPSHTQSSGAVTGINRSVKDEITLSPSDRACARRLSAALKAMDISIGDGVEKDDDEAETGRSSLPSGPSSFRLGSAGIRGIPIPHRAQERDSQGEDGGEGLISDTFEADMFGTSPDQSSGLGIVNTLPVRSSSKILGTAPPPSAPLPSIPSATEEEEDGMGSFTAVKPRPRSDSNSSLSLERRRAVFLASSEEGVVGSSGFLAGDEESGSSTGTSGQLVVGTGTGRRIRSVDDAMTALSARKSSLTGSAVTSDPPGVSVSAPTYRSHSSWSRSSAGGTRLSDLLEEGEEMEDTVPHRMSSTGTLAEDVASPALSSGGDRYSVDSHEMTLATPQGEYNFQTEFSNRKMQFDGNVETMADELFFKSPQAARRDSSVLQPGWI